MIWNSVVTMSLIDIVIVAATVALGVILVRQYPTMRRLGISAAAIGLFAGVAVIAALYLTDLIVMHLLPSIVGPDIAMSLMADLHLNWSWLAVLLGVATLVTAIGYIVNTVVPRTAQLLERLGQARDELAAQLAARTEAERNLEHGRRDLEQQIVQTRVLAETNANLADDNERRVKAELELRYRSRIDRLISHWSNAFLTLGPDELPGSISAALADIARGTDADFVELELRQPIQGRCRWTCGDAPASPGKPDIDTNRSRSDTVIDVPMLSRDQVAGHLRLRWQCNRSAPPTCLPELLTLAADMFLSVMRHMEAADALYASETRFRDVAEVTFESIWETDEELRLTYLSDAPDMKCFNRERLLGRFLWDGVETDAQRSVDGTELRVLLARGHPFRDLQVTIRDDAGETRYLKLGGGPYYDTEGRFCGYRGVAMDETSNRLRAQALEQSEAKYRGLFENVPAGVFRALPDGRLLSANPALVAMYGYDSEQDLLESTGRRWFCESDSERDAILTQLAAHGQVRDAEVIETRRDGQTFDALLTVDGVWNAQGALQYIDGTVSDVSERKRTEAALREHQSRLRRLASELALAEERVRRDTAADLHDGLAQNLFIARLKLNLLERHEASAPLRAASAEIAAILEDAISKTRTMITELSPPVLYDLGLDAAITWLCEHMAELHGLRCLFERDGEPIDLDAELAVVIFKTIRELVQNVSKHAGVDEAVVRIAYAPSEVRVEVQDRGVGFDPPALQTSPGATHGFGLFSITERVFALGGHLEINSASDRGTLAIMRLPLQHGRVASSGQALDQSASAVG